MVSQLFDVARAAPPFGDPNRILARGNQRPVTNPDSAPVQDAFEDDFGDDIFAGLFDESGDGGLGLSAYEEERQAIFDQLGIDAAGMSNNADIVNALLRATLDAGPDPDFPAQFADDIAKLAKLESDLRQTASGSISLDDGTLITLDQYQSADPMVQAQIKQHLVNQQIALENQSRALINEYGLQQYDLSRAAHNDANAAAVSNFRNKSQEFRDRLALDELTLENAVAQVERQLGGLSENRSRVQLEAQTAADFAPTGTTGGKVAFTGADVGAGISNLFRQGGVQNPESTELIRFPGVISVDPAGRLAQRDAELGVGGELAGIPGLNTNLGHIASAPSIAGYGGAPPDLLRMLGPASLDIASLLANMQGGAGASAAGASPSAAAVGGGNQTPGAIEAMYADIQARMGQPTAARGRGGQGGAAPSAHGLDFLDPRQVDPGAIVNALYENLVKIPTAARGGR